LKGILFKTDMIQAIVEGRKTVTRRLGGLNDINMIGLDGAGQPTSPDQYRLLGIHDGLADFVRTAVATPSLNIGVVYHCKPRYQVGETVYIKEAWRPDDTFKGGGIPRLGIQFGEAVIWKADNPDQSGKWHSPMMMPQWAARYFILIKDVRAERLQEIPHNEVIAEGIDITTTNYPSTKFKELWNSINKDYPWESNPWIFKYEFELVK